MANAQSSDKGQDTSQQSQRRRGHCKYGNARAVEWKPYLVSARTGAHAQGFVEVTQRSCVAKSK